MPTIAQMKVRQGNLSDLPILQAGEFGYALDVQRLYIGNTPSTQAGDGTTTVFTFQSVDTDNDGTTTNNAVLTFGQRLAYAVYLEESGTETLQANGTDYTSSDSSITFTTAPTATQTVKVYYNTEVITSSPDSGSAIDPDSKTLVATISGTPTNAGVAVDGNNYDFVDINYTLSNTNGNRKGTISVYIDATGNSSTLDDSYVTSVNPASTDLDVIFTGVVASGVFNLQYTSTNNADMSYVITNWKSA